MSTRTLHLVAFRQSARQRTHFAIFVPSDANSTTGTLIHVVGIPMTGYTLEFKRNYCPEGSNQPYTTTPIGQVYSNLIVDSVTTVRSADDRPNGNIEVVASQVPPPRISANFLQPVNVTTNRRCQEWTTDYAKRLVTVCYLGETAIDIVQNKRDPPSYGIGLQPAGRGRGGPAPVQAGAAGPATVTTGANPSPWVWDVDRRTYRRWDGAKWIWQ